MYFITGVIVKFLHTKAAFAAVLNMSSSDHMDK